MSSIDYTPALLAHITDLSMRMTKLEANYSALEASNQSLKTELERVTGQTVVPKTNSSMKTSIPLTPMMHSIPTISNPIQPYHGNPNGFSSQAGRKIPMLRRNAGQFIASSPTAPNTPAILPSTAPVTDLTYSIPPCTVDYPHLVPHSAPHKVIRSKRVNHPMGEKRKNDDSKQKAIEDILMKGEEVIIQIGTGKDEQGNFTHTSCLTHFNGIELIVKECELIPSIVGMSASFPGKIVYKFMEELKNANHIKKLFNIDPWRLCFVVRDGKRMSLEQVRATLST